MDNESASMKASTESIYNVEGLLNSRLEYLKQSLASFEESFQIQMQDYTEKSDIYAANPTSENQAIVMASFNELKKISVDMQDIQTRVNNITNALNGTLENTEDISEDIESSHTL